MLCLGDTPTISKNVFIVWCDVVLCLGDTPTINKNVFIVWCDIVLCLGDMPSISENVAVMWFSVLSLCGMVWCDVMQYDTMVYFKVVWWFWVIVYMI